MEPARISIPLFPLGTVLFPGGVLPLKVFEVRYQEMTKCCLRDDTPFGVCRIREGNEVGDPAVPVAIGCTARIAEWDMPHPNLFHLRAIGEHRFRILTTEVARHGLLTCEAELLPEPAAPVAPDPGCRRLLERLIERYGANAFPEPPALDDGSWVTYRLAEVLPMTAEARQTLLETDDPAARMSIVQRVLAEAGVA